MANTVHTLAPRHARMDVCPRATDGAVVRINRTPPARPHHVMLVTNDLAAGQGTASVLADTSCVITLAETLEAALALSRSITFDLAIVDFRPDLIGHEATRRLRVAGMTAPILFISALTSHAAWEQARQAGADAVMSMPVDATVLGTRMASLVRQHDPARQTQLLLGPLRIVPAARTAFVAGYELALSPVEYAVLETLAARGGAPLRKQALLDHLLAAGHAIGVEAVEAALSLLRRKLADAGLARTIRTVGRLGHALGVPGDVATVWAADPLAAARAA